VALCFFGCPSYHRPMLTPGLIIAVASLAVAFAVALFIRWRARVSKIASETLGCSSVPSGD